MQKIIDPVPAELLKAELTEDKFLRDTNRAGNKIYVINATNAPNVMREIGRLREIAFREGGGGTGKDMDLDKFDLDPAFCYKQLVLWDPESECIVGGYRYVLCDEVLYDRFGQPVMPSSHLFTFTKSYLKRAFLETIELSRSFVSPAYQSTRNDSKSLYALDNLFDGLGALMLLYKGRMKYFFGKMTIYPSFPEDALKMLLFFLRKHFGPREEKLVIPKNPVRIGDTSKFRKVFTERSFKEDYKILKNEIHTRFGVNIPPLVNTYMNMSPTMKSFGAGINDEFGDVIEAGILIKFDEMHPEKANRHMRMPEIHLKRLRNWRIKERRKK